MNAQSCVPVKIFVQKQVFFANNCHFRVHNLHMYFLLSISINIYKFKGKYISYYILVSLSSPFYDEIILCLYFENDIRQFLLSTHKM